LREIVYIKSIYLNRLGMMKEH